MLEVNRKNRVRPFASAVLAGVVVLGSTGPAWSRPKDDSPEFITRPLPTDYRTNKDGSITARICYNWSCAVRERVTFTPADLAAVKGYLSQCTGTSLHDRVQKLRVGIWQLQLVAQRHLPQLANDREINEFDREVDGRLDCVDSSSNTTTYLKILQDLGELPGWSVTTPEVRNLMDFHGVHWTAVVVNSDGTRWSVDSWFRPHGHLPFVMPLADWVKDKKAWKPPYDKANPYPDSIQDLCPAPRPATDTAQAPMPPTAVATLRR